MCFLQMWGIFALLSSATLSPAQRSGRFVHTYHRPTFWVGKDQLLKSFFFEGIQNQMLRWILGYQLRNNTSLDTAINGRVGLGACGFEGRSLRGTWAWVTKYESGRGSWCEAVHDLPNQGYGYLVNETELKREFVCTQGCECWHVLAWELWEWMDRSRKGPAKLDDPHGDNGESGRRRLGQSEG